MTFSKNVNSKTNDSLPQKLMIYGGAWLVVWLVLATVFELRERMITWGIFGPNCGSCVEQTTASIIAAIWAPLLLGSLVFSIGATNALWRIKQPVLAAAVKLPTIILLLTAVTYLFYGLYALFNLLR
ncbi:hypothetical protein D3C85_799490 [compost metagenome]